MISERRCANYTRCRSVLTTKIYPLPKEAEYLFPRTALKRFGKRLCRGCSKEVQEILSRPLPDVELETANLLASMPVAHHHTKLTSGVPASKPSTTATAATTASSTQTTKRSKPQPAYPLIKPVSPPPVPVASPATATSAPVTLPPLKTTTFKAKATSKVQRTNSNGKANSQQPILVNVPMRGVSAESYKSSIGYLSNSTLPMFAGPPLLNSLLPQQRQQHSDASSSSSTPPSPPSSVVDSPSTFLPPTGPATTPLPATATNNRSSLEAIDPIMELMNGFKKSQVLFSAVELGIFAAFESPSAQQANGCLDSLTVAQLLGLHPESTERLLQACVSLGLLYKSTTTKRPAQTSSTPYTYPTSQPIASIAFGNPPSPNSALSECVSSNEAEEKAAGTAPQQSATADSTSSTSSDSEAEAKRVKTGEYDPASVTNSYFRSTAGQKPVDVYSLTPASRKWLSPNSQHQITGYIHHSQQLMYPLWGNLSTAVRSGNAVWKESFGLDDGGEVFRRIYDTPAHVDRFIHGMHSFANTTCDAVFNAFDLSKFKHVVDLGGGTGAFTASCVQRYPSVQATLVELAGVLPYTKQYMAQQPKEVQNAVTLHAGDFFADTIPQGDLYLLARIIHDWDEQRIITLFRKIYCALPKGGALLIAETLLNDDKSGPAWGHLQSLSMLVQTNGKERSLAEYRQLLEFVGFSNVSGVQTGTPLDAILAHRPL